MITKAKSSFAVAKSRTAVARAKPQAGIFRVAAIQMASGPNVAANLSEAERLIGMAAAQDAKLVVLPEYFGIMGMKDTDKVEAREAEGKGPMQQFLSAMAKKHKIWLIGGSVPLEASAASKVRNSCLVYDDSGKRWRATTRSTCSAWTSATRNTSEEQTIEPGDKVVVVETPFGRIGLSVCYDLRFPELYRAMGDVDIIVVPAAFTETTGRAHWETLIRARAIENLAYVLAPAQGGYHLTGRETHGNSMIVDPWGVVLDRLPRGSGVVIANVNPAYQASLRKSLPALTHRTLKNC